MGVVEALTGIASSFGFSASAGLNAYLTFLIVALAARFTSLIHLNAPYDALTSGWIIGLLLILTLVEGLVDKIPAVDTANDLVQSFVRPVAGAILFAASSNVIADLHPVLALACGLLISGVVHSAKAAARPAITAMTAGVGNPIVSTLEDIVAAITTLLSLLVPVLALILIAVGAGLFWRVVHPSRTEA